MTPAQDDLEKLRESEQPLAGPQRVQPRGLGGRGRVSPDCRESSISIEFNLRACAALVPIPIDPIARTITTDATQRKKEVQLDKFSFMERCKMCVCEVSVFRSQSQ